MNSSVAQLAYASEPSACKTRQPLPCRERGEEARVTLLCHDVQDDGHLDHTPMFGMRVESVTVLLVCMRMVQSHIQIHEICECHACDAKSGDMKSANGMHIMQ